MNATTLTRYPLVDLTEAKLQDLVERDPALRTIRVPYGNCWFVAIRILRTPDSPLHGRLAIVMDPTLSASQEWSVE